jgi:hypothetical protein
MENITTSAELKKAIQVLEVDQYVQGQELKAQLLIIVDSFKPINILKNSVKDIVSSPFLVDNLIGSAVSMATGYFSKKLLVGVSGKIIRKFLGPLFNYGVKKVVAHSPISIKSIGQSILQRFTNKKQTTTLS